MIDPDLAHKALAHPFRREVLRWLKSPEQFLSSARLHSSHGMPLSAIVARSGLSQSTVSAHVALLREAGLVIATPVGQWIFVARDDAAIADFIAGMAREF
ncbi:ArsR/SmtB family transcription factor [Burkholderia gladioli]|uniref:ArsR/SmtB family transcription factor n=1 Tax=Burkholderia gladioli TaxID=28095 RepID=UPI0016421555|nr:helix-turn-helix domain-containing protein [Burkholderia gladioli]MBU9322619.1 helix-turn-helix domain-containing protein [Burkholderia gladioli]MBU9685231.1 helix-turn-helix domain-containing protein [Burkholderia gladioli]MCA8167237.1 helix-turn-helix domain-containing protein [Burkholderia gladioli]